MGAETSDPGGQQDVSFTDKDDEALEVAERALDTDALNPSLYGDFAGSSKFSAQQKGSITGSRAMDALVPGVGTLSVVSALSADYMQQSLQRGASPVYGGGQIQGVVNETQAFGTTFSTYSGNTDYDPIGNNNNTSGGNDSGVAAVNTSAVNKVVKAPVKNVSPSRVSSYNPNAVVSASGSSSNSNIKRSGRRSTILTSSRGDTSQLTTIMKPGLRGTLG
jgi:hypothetical protein